MDFIYICNDVLGHQELNQQVIEQKCKKLNKLSQRNNIQGTNFFVSKGMIQKPHGQHNTRNAPNGRNVGNPGSPTTPPYNRLFIFIYKYIYI
jgi:hypothetical protein